MKLRFLQRERVRYATALLDLAKTLLLGCDLVVSASSDTQKKLSDIQLGVGRVHTGSGGAAPLILDLDSGQYRESTLKDLYDAARLVDNLDNIHFFSRSMTARDMPNVRLLDLNTAYACLAGTRKHVISAATEAANIEVMFQCNMNQIART